MARTYTQPPERTDPLPSRLAPLLFAALLARPRPPTPYPVREPTVDPEPSWNWSAGHELAPDPAGRPVSAAQVLALLAAAMPADAGEEDRPWPAWATGRLDGWQASAMERPPLAPRSV
jgi:hypothetical protein